MKIIILFILGVVTCSTTRAQEKLFTLIRDSTVLKNENDLLINDFESRIKKIDNSIDFNGLKTIVRDSLFSGYYLPSNNRIYLTRGKQHQK